MRENVVSALILIFIFVAGFGLGLIFQGPTNVGLIEEKKEVKVIPVENYKIFSEVKTKLVAVNQNGDGVLTNLTVRAIPGNGRVLVDVESILFWIDTQQSIQIAKKVAEDYIERNITNADITYTIDIPNTTLVGGPSAGAAFAVATIAVIENKTIRNDTVITGTIESDGKIGQVGGIIAKGKAVKEAGYGHFLVPMGQGEFSEYKKVETCSKYGSMKVCNIKYKKVYVNVEKEIGINVKEVSNIDEAVKYLLE
ncbi:MAG: hypothetical protein J7K87_02870 [Candidatus Aenigmarchaeota archaeon]|nr:hypothetical protein [Candidatus Aenigmarchaeota archaeon]